jgi:hypothetical protein
MMICMRSLPRFFAFLVGFGFVGDRQGRAGSPGGTARYKRRRRHMDLGCHITGNFTRASNARSQGADGDAAPFGNMFGLDPRGQLDQEVKLVSGHPMLQQS